MDTVSSERHAVQESANQYLFRETQLQFKPQKAGTIAAVDLQRYDAVKVIHDCILGRAGDHIFFQLSDPKKVAIGAVPATLTDIECIQSDSNKHHYGRILYLNAFQGLIEQVKTSLGQFPMNSALSTLLQELSRLNNFLSGKSTDVAEISKDLDIGIPHTLLRVPAEFSSLHKTAFFALTNSFAPEDRALFKHYLRGPKGIKSIESALHDMREQCGSRKSVILGTGTFSKTRVALDLQTRKFYAVSKTMRGVGDLANVTRLHRHLKHIMELQRKRQDISEVTSKIRSVFLRTRKCDRVQDQAGNIPQNKSLYIIQELGSATLGSFTDRLHAFHAALNIASADPVKRQNFVRTLQSTWFGLRDQQGAIDELNALEKQAWAVLLADVSSNDLSINHVLDAVAYLATLATAKLHRLNLSHQDIKIDNLAFFENKVQRRGRQGMYTLRHYGMKFIDLASLIPVDPNRNYRPRIKAPFFAPPESHLLNPDGSSSFKPMYQDTYALGLCIKYLMGYAENHHSISSESFWRFYNENTKSVQYQESLKYYQNWVRELQERYSGQQLTHLNTMLDDGRFIEFLKNELLNPGQEVTSDSVLIDVRDLQIPMLLARLEKVKPKANSEALLLNIIFHIQWQMHAIEAATGQANQPVIVDPQSLLLSRKAVNGDHELNLILNRSIIDMRFQSGQFDWNDIADAMLQHNPVDRIKPESLLSPDGRELNTKLQRTHRQNLLAQPDLMGKTIEILLDMMSHVELSGYIDQFLNENAIMSINAASSVSRIALKSASCYDPYQDNRAVKPKQSIGLGRFLKPHPESVEWKKRLSTEPGLSLNT